MMFQVFIITFLVLIIVAAAMAIGVIFGRSAIKGSCGGLGSIDGLESACDRCSEPCEKRKKLLAAKDNSLNNLKA